MIIEGRKIATEIIEKLKKYEKVSTFLAVFVVGKNNVSEKFIEQKKKIAGELGIDFRVYNFSEDVTQDELRKQVVKTGKHKTCGGIIIQLPLPDHINKHYVLNAIPKDKDVDVLGERALGAFYTSRNRVLPPAVEVFQEILKIQKLEIKNCSIAIVGVGFLIGKPIAVWLSGKCQNLILLDKGGDMSLLKNVDIIVCGTGSAGIIRPEMIRDNTLVIDFGYSIKDGKILGDFSQEEFKNQNSKTKINFTPTPGGTGPILVVKLFENFLILNEE